MSLTILTTACERLSCPAVVHNVRTGASQGGVCVLVPTFDEALRMQKDLAYHGLALGVSVGTIGSWTRDLWDVWGDGRRVVDGSVRALLVSELVRGETAEDGMLPDATPGTIQFLSGLFSHGLPWLEYALDGKDCLTPAERRLAELATPYEALLYERGLVEGAHVACMLPARLEESGFVLPPVVLVGFETLTRAEQEFVAGVARSTSVTVVGRSANALADHGQARTVELLAMRAADLGVEVVRERDDEGEPCARSQELASLLRGLFDTAVPRIAPTGDVRLLEPSGPLAEAEIVAREVTELVGAGSSDVVAVVVDARRAWRELAPKLVARGVSVRARLSVPVLDTPSGRAFVGYVRTVAQLKALAQDWPASEQDAEGTIVRLGNMDWWPPRDLVDFLLSDISHVPRDRAYALDVAWRGNRLLSPGDVLSQLGNAKSTSMPLERATRELMRGRLGSAASRLLAPYVEATAEHCTSSTREDDVLAREEAVGVLKAALGAAGLLKELGISADSKAESRVDLLDLVDKVELVLRSSRLSLRPRVEASRGKGSVLIVDRRQASTLAPASFDAAILCGMTSSEFGVPSGDDELTGMLEAMEIEPPHDSLSAQRALFWRLCALPRRGLLLERSRFAADASETYPAVMLGELLAGYDGALPASTLSEDDARANLSLAGLAPRSCASECVGPSGRVNPALRNLVIVPQQGREEQPDDLPVLSASQLESYLECPLKWFSLRRLRLGDNDAGFGPMEMGTFAHRVLELTYQQLFEEGRSRLDPTNADDMAHAHTVLGACFDTHLRHQFMRKGSRPAYQALVAHSSSQESAIDRLRRDLLSALDYSAQRMRGFVPSAFEWEFGRGRHTTRGDGLPEIPEAIYAGVRVTGTVDRIDIDDHGRAVVIDYKHKGPTGFFAEYAAFAKGASDDSFAIPRRIQALLYAQVVRRAFPDLKVVGALYLGTRGAHELSGAVDENLIDAVFGDDLGTRRAPLVTVSRTDDFGQGDERGMDAFLDAVEDAIAGKVELLRQGHIEAEPKDKAACAFCPVLNCERRLA